MILCAQCLTPLVELPTGAHQQCCDGAGYWSDIEPLPDDAYKQRVINGLRLFCRPWRKKERRIKKPYGDKR